MDGGREEENDGGSGGRKHGEKIEKRERCKVQKGNRGRFFEYMMTLSSCFASSFVMLYLCSLPKHPKQHVG